MSKAAKPFSRTNASAHPAGQQRMIAEQTAAFLSGGGEIQKIPRGVSGQAKLGGPMLRPREGAAEPSSSK
jgi:hypothetical protein